MRTTALVATLVLGTIAAVDADLVVATGKVVDQQGRPVPDAEVWTWAPHRDEDMRTRSDLHGVFRLEFDPGDRRYWPVLAIAPGLSVGACDYSVEEPKPLLIRLVPEATVHGVVVDPQGQPVPGAEVLLRALFGLPATQPDGQDEHILLGWDGPIRDTTGADGKFVIGHVPEGAKAELQVKAAALAIWRYWFVPGGRPAIGGAPEDYTISLRPSGAIEGTVTRDGKPLAGIEVFTQGLGSTEGWDEATTDTDGRYRMDRLAPGTYNVLIRDTARLVAPGHETVIVEVGKTRKGIDFAMTSGGVIQGRVVDAETGDGVPMARVGCYGPARPRSGGACVSTATDEEGRYSLRAAPGVNHVYYQGGKQEYARPADTRFEVEVLEGQTVEAPSIALPHVRPIKVHVIDAEGEPAAGATVWPLSGFSRPATTDADGRCLLYGDEPNDVLALAARGQAEATSGVAMVSVTQQPDPVVITLAENATVTLRLVDTEGEPLAGIETVARIDVEITTPWPGGPSSETLGRAGSDAEGVIRFDALPPGSSPAFYVRPRTATPTEWPECPLLEPATAYDLGEVVLDLTTVSVAGTVLLPDQTPVEGAFVRPHMGGFDAVRTDAEGRFELQGLLPTEHVLLLAASPDWKLFGAEELVPEWGLEPGIMLSAPLRVVGRLVGADGQPLARQRARLTPAWGSATEDFPVERETVTDQDGTLVIEGMVAGVTYGMLVYSHPVQRIRWALTFVPEAEPEVDLGTIILPDR